MIESQIQEAKASEAVRVVKVDVAYMGFKDDFDARRNGNWLIIEASKFPEWIAEHLGYMEEDEDAFLIQASTMTREELDNLPEHDGW